MLNEAIPHTVKHSETYSYKTRYFFPHGYARSLAFTSFSPASAAV
jgi:hypothetical protein